MSTTTVPVPGRTRARGADAAPSLLRLTRVELRKAYDTRAGLWLLIVIALTSVAVVSLQMIFLDGPGTTFAGYFTTTQLPTGLLLPVLGILLVTSEWSQRTAMTTFALVPQRSRVLIAKLLAGTVLALLGVAAAASASAVATLLTPVLTDADSGWSITAGHVGQVVVIQVTYLLIGVAFGMALLSSPLAIVVYILLPTIFTVLVSLVRSLDWMREWLDLSTTSFPMYEGRLDASGWVHVGVSAAAWLLPPLVVGWLRVTRREIG